jgi:glycosyltransferase involved in cell wall biosynthesis
MGIAVPGFRARRSIQAWSGRQSNSDVATLMKDLMARAPDADGAGNGQCGRRKQRRPLISIVIPTLNEEPNLPFVLPKIGRWVYEVVLVDGRSTDKTLETARALFPGIRIVHQSGHGKGAALRAGFAAARGDIIVMLDGDGSTDPTEIPAFVGALLAGAEFVKGTRFAQGAGTADMSRIRVLGNRAFVLLVRLLFGGRFSDLCYGYIAFWRRVLPELDLDSDGFEIESQMSIQALRAGLRITEVPSFEHRRIHGKSNLRTVPDGWRVLKTILHERFKRNSRRLRVPTVIEEPAARGVAA